MFSLFGNLMLYTYLKNKKNIKIQQKQIEKSYYIYYIGIAYQIRTDFTVLRRLRLSHWTNAPQQRKQGEHLVLLSKIEF